MGLHVDKTAQFSSLLLWLLAHQHKAAVVKIQLSKPTYSMSRVLSAAYPLWRAIDSRWNRNAAFLASWVTVVMRLYRSTALVQRPLVPRANTLTATVKRCVRQAALRIFSVISCTFTLLSAALCIQFNNDRHPIAVANTLRALVLGGVH